MHSYQAARTYFGLLEFLSWGVVLLGAILAVVAVGTVGHMSRGFGGSPMAGLAGLVPGIAIMFLGFLGLVGVQIGRAGVDSAEYAQQNLKVARDQLEVSRQALKQGTLVEKGYAALQAAKQELREGAKPSTAPPTPSYADAKPPDESENVTANHTMKTIDYRGMQIEKRADGYYVGSSFFVGLNGAQKDIDRRINEAAALPISSSVPRPETDKTSADATPQTDRVSRT